MYKPEYRIFKTKISNNKPWKKNKAEYQLVSLK